MRLSICLLAIVSILAASFACRDDRANAYLQSGKLKERIELLELQGGFAGFSGMYYVIEPDGAWVTGQVLPPKQIKAEPTASGKLSSEQLKALAALLAQHDIATLPNLGKPTVNPRVIRIQHGGRVSELLPGLEPSPQDEDTATRGRFEGIASALKRLCKAP